MFFNPLDLIPKWLPWLLGGGTITWIVLAVFFPSIIVILTPWIRALSEALIEYLGMLWKGFKDVVDDLSTIIFVATLCVLVFSYAKGWL